MTVAEKKIDLFSRPSNLQDDDILDQLKSIRKNTVVDTYQKKLSPISMEEFENRVAEAEEG